MNIGDRVGWEDISGTRHGTIIMTGLTWDNKVQIRGDDGEWYVVPENQVYRHDDYNMIFTLWNGKELVERYPQDAYEEFEIRQLAIYRRHEHDAKRVLVKKGARWLVQF